jgi:ubiquitin carboxyl-terminal hydrolase 31
VSKISSFVEFPLEGLDLSPHVFGRSVSPLSASALSLATPINSCFGLSWKQRSFKKPRPPSLNNRLRRPEQPPLEPPPMTYDLFAVCNHHGKDLQGGHYTGKITFKNIFIQKVLKSMGKNKNFAKTRKTGLQMLCKE